MGDYGITAGDLNDLQTAIDDFSALISEPGVAIGDRKTSTAELDVLTRDGYSTLNNRLDTLVEGFRESDPEFYSNYQNARLIVDTGRVKTSLKGTVRDSSTGDVLRGARVTIVEQKVFRTTNIRGNYRFGRVRPGTYTLRCSLEGYQDTVLTNVELLETRLNDVDFTLTAL